jgi:ATP-dependent helicase/nuclease subunit A
MSSRIFETIKLQQLASNPKNSSWVFASAGSGKTKILTDRTLRLLLDDVDPSKILCLTFTKVAAAEMQNRINHELEKWILCSEDDLREKLFNLSGSNPDNNQVKKAQNLFVKILNSESKIKIQTIHSFCQGIIKSFPFESEVSVNFELIEENQKNLLLKKARKNILQKAFLNDDLRSLVENLNAKTNEESFESLIGEILQKKDDFFALKEKFFTIENAIIEIFEKFHLKETDSIEQKFSEFFSQLNFLKITEFVSKLEEGNSTKNLSSAKQIKEFLLHKKFEKFSDYYSAFFTNENSPRKFYGAAAKDENLLKFADSCREEITVFLDQINSLTIAQNTATLLKYTDLVLQNYQDLKNANHLLDYDDLIRKTNQLLTNPDFSEWVKMKMDGSFDHILVDESQDTNHQQWSIIKSLSEDFFSGFSSSNKNRSIFIVGDEKQSIYGFQGADSKISSEIFDYFSQKLGNQLKKIELTNSFRSQKEILQAVDDVFKDQDRQKAISQATDFKGHKAIKDGVGKVEIWPQITSEKPEKNDDKNLEWQINFDQKSDLSEAEILSQIIAKKILYKVENESAKYGDFMILLRKRTNQLDKILARSFNQYQIPFSSVGSIHFNKNLLIQDLLAAANFALLPQDDLNLACLLKSPFFTISEDELLEICLLKNRDKTSIFNCINQTKKFKEISEQLAEIYQKSKELTCFEFFYFLLKERNYQLSFISRFGDEALKIIDKFMMTTYDFCQNSSTNLQKFIEFTSKLDVKISLNSPDDNSVKITTIHSAKGLQSSIVILPDCCYNFGQMLVTKEKISWLEYEDVKIPLWCGSKDEENSILKKHRLEKIKQDKDEYLRLLYVAMTRAENELYIAGFGKAKDPESWYEIIRNSLDYIEPTSISDWSEEQFQNNKDYKLVSKNPTKATISKRQEIGDLEKVSNPINLAQIKGRLIHKIMEFIGKNHGEKKEWLMQISQKIIAQESFLNIETKQKVSHEISSFLNSERFKQIFSGKVYCEIEISAAHDKSMVQRLDLLVERENEILIIDYKSDEETGEVPQKYLNQLKSYQESAQRIYPKHQILTAILWLNDLKLEILNQV